MIKNREELIAFHAQICERGRKIMEAKNHDYAGEHGLFQNFTRCEAMGACKTEQGFLVRIIDKLSRLTTFVSAGKLMVSNESYDDACVDIINYIILFMGYQLNKIEIDHRAIEPSVLRQGQDLLDEVKLTQNSKDQARFDAWIVAHGEELLALAMQRTLREELQKGE